MLSFLASSNNGDGTTAIPQWQNGTVAIGLRLESGDNALAGTGWLIDVPAGLICTCAHVVIDGYPWPERPNVLDAALHGVAIGVGSPPRWWCRADLRYLSSPPNDLGYPHTTPSHWPPDGDRGRLDLAVLQLVNWDGSPLMPRLNDPIAPLWHRAGEDAIALPLCRAGALNEGDELVLLGYGQGKDMGDGERRTSTTCRGFYCGQHTKLESGDWLKTGVAIYSCAPFARRLTCISSCPLCLHLN